MSTLEFTKRFGYEKDSAIGTITMGCCNALWSLRNHFESKHQGDTGCIFYQDRCRRGASFAKEQMSFKGVEE